MSSKPLSQVGGSFAVAPPGSLRKRALIHTPARGSQHSDNKAAMAQSSAQPEEGLLPLTGVRLPPPAQPWLTEGFTPRFSLLTCLRRPPYAHPKAHPVLASLLLRGESSGSPFGCNTEAQAAEGGGPPAGKLRSELFLCADCRTLHITEQYRRLLRPSSQRGPRRPPRQA